MKSNKFAMLFPILVTMMGEHNENAKPVAHYQKPKKVRDCTICGTDIFSNNTVVCSAKCYKALVKRNRLKKMKK